MDLKLAFLFVFALCFFSIGLSLKCRCSGVTCVDKTEEDCPEVGVTKYGCKCCKVCAQNIGESCGGVYNVSGICGRNLECVKPPPPEGADEHTASIHNFNSRGTCQKKIEN
uniref:TSA: Tityus bahiensis Tbah02317 mRNA sequence n=1 Tax=Tityus bahiensis TaxID=50343 RepID=A0A0C9RPA6_TITBA